MASLFSTLLIDLHPTISGWRAANALSPERNRLVPAFTCCLIGGAAPLGIQDRPLKIVAVHSGHDGFALIRKSMG
jgi:hypothetical protein